MRVRSGRAAPRARRQVVVAGQPLAIGRHALTLAAPGLDLELDLQVVVGERRGPRAFLVGGVAPGDAAGLAVARGVVAALDPAGLAGSVVALGRASPSGAPLRAAFRTATPRREGDGDTAEARLAEWLLATLTEKAAFGVEIRSGPPDRVTYPHLRAGLDDQRVRRLARDFGLEVVLDRAGARSSLRRAACAAGVPTLTCEGGELGRHDAGFVARATEGVLNLLRARKLLPGASRRPAWRAIAGEAVWLRPARDGWPEAQVAPGDVVDPGDALVRVYDEAGRELAVIVAPARGVVLSVPAAARVTDRSPLVLLGRLRTTTRRLAPAPPPRRRLGWCEWVALPDLGIRKLHAKIDTGARTSALHVRSMKQVGEVAGRPVLEVKLPAGRRARVEVEEFVVVRDSGGHAERRPVIQTTIVLGPVRRRVRITLTDRGDMLFPMLVGRTALGEDFVIDASARHLLDVDR